MAADTSEWVAITTSIVALAGTIYSNIANYVGQQKVEHLRDQFQQARDARQAEQHTRELISKFRDPLMHAAYDLQSRIYNIFRGNFLTLYYVNGSAAEQEYAVENTVFLVAQFLGWTEAIRQEIQFLDLGGEADSKRLRRLQEDIFAQLQSGQFSRQFRLFAGEQRAIGELMIEGGPKGSCRCIGFAAFMTRRKPALDTWLNPLRDDVKQMATDPKSAAERLTQIQHLLIDLLAFLDPEFVRFPAASRSKV